MVISKVGYASRRISVSISEKDDSAWYSILLRPQPLALEEVVVSASHPSTSTTINTLYPETDKSDAYCAYGAETSIPIGILFGDSLVYMYAFEQCAVDSEQYLHLWLLISNRSRRVVDFDALRDVELSVNGKNRFYGNILPTAADKIPADGVKQSAEGSPFLIRIQASFSASSKEREFYIDNILRFDLKAGRPWLGWNAPDEVQGGINPASLHDIYANSQHVGILGRYNIYPGNAISGSIFMPFPGMRWKSSMNSLESGVEYRYVFSIRTSIGKTSIAFSAH
jgi:hypothetical protein